MSFSFKVNEITASRSSVWDCEINERSQLSLGFSLFQELGLICIGVSKQVARPIRAVNAAEPMRMGDG
jgi:hypothetical protein